jgi:hypothetical protein
MKPTLDPQRGCGTHGDSRPGNQNEIVLPLLANLCENQHISGERDPGQPPVPGFECHLERQPAMFCFDFSTFALRSMSTTEAAI